MASDPDTKPKRPRSQAQRAASRANGAASHGPKTPAGKDRSRFNALKHGLCGEFVLLPGESIQGYNLLRQAYYDRFQPLDPIESSTVDLLVKLDWQIARATVDERNVVFLRMDDQRERFNREFSDPHPSLRITRARQVEMQPGEAGDILDRHLNRLDRAYNRALHRLHFLRTKFPPASDLPQGGPQHSLPPSPEPASLNSRNEPEPLVTLLEPTPPESAQAAPPPTAAPVRTVVAFANYVLELPLASAPSATPADSPETARERPKLTCAAA